MATPLYLTTRSLGVLALAPYPGTWNETSIGQRLHGQVNWIRRMRGTRTNGGGITFTAVGETNDTPDWDLAVGLWVTDPLDVDQTISGTLTWILAAARDDNASAVQWYVYAYVMAGDDPQAIRGTLYEGAVAPDVAFGPVATFRGPSAPLALTSVNGIAGDRIGVVIGFRFLNAAVADDVTVFNTMARLYFGTTNSLQTIEQPDGILGDTNTTTACGFLTLSQTLTFAAAVAAPANDACADAEVIATFPFHGARIDTTESADTRRGVWYTFTAPRDMEVAISTLGSNYPVFLDLYSGGCGALVTRPVLAGSGGSGTWVQRAPTVFLYAVTSGVQYWINVQSGDGSSAGAPGGGGSLLLSVTERFTDLQANDIYVDCQLVVKYRDGELATVYAGLYGSTPTGNAIDTTLRLLEGFGPHTAERLYVGLFGSNPLIEVLDLRTLAEVGFTFSNLDTNENIATMVFDRSGRLLLGWYGDNYNEIGALSSPAACRLRRFDAVSLDSEAGAPPEAEAFSVVQEVGGSDFAELAADNDTVWYTSAGRKIMRVSLTSGQLADFVTVPIESGPRPGLRGVRLLPPGDGSGGILVADGINVKRYNAAAQLVQVYTPTPSVHAQDLDKIEIVSDGLSFYVSDQLATSIFHFDLATGVQLGEIVTGLPTGQLSGFSLYQGYRAGVGEEPPEEPPGGGGEEPPEVLGHGCPDIFPIDPGGGGNGCPVPFFP